MFEFELLKVHFDPCLSTTYHLIELNLYRSSSHVCHFQKSILFSLSLSLILVLQIYLSSEHTPDKHHHILPIPHPTCKTGMAAETWPFFRAQTEGQPGRYTSSATNLLQALKSSVACEHGHVYPRTEACLSPAEGSSRSRTRRFLHAFRYSGGPEIKFFRRKWSCADSSQKVSRAFQPGDASR